MNRRDFLLSTSSLLLTPALVNPQSASASSLFVFCQEPAPNAYLPYLLDSHDPTINQEPWATLKIFADNAKDRRIWNPVDVFGVSGDHLIVLDTAITLKVIGEEFDFVPGKFTVDSLANKIKTTAIKVCANEHIDPSSNLAQRIIAAGISSWIRTHVTFNEALTNDKLPYKLRSLFWTSRTLLKQQNCLAVCAGIARLTDDVSHAAGLVSKHMIGVVRDWGNQIPPTFTHSWVQYQFSVKDSAVPFNCPSDNTLGRISLQKARTLRGQINSPYSLPIYPADWGYYLWRECALGVDGNPEIMVPENLRLLQFTEDEWRQIDRRGPQDVMVRIEENIAGATVNINPQ